MDEQAEKAKALLEIALSTYRDDLLPALPSDKRYTGAMVANALGIAERRLQQPDPADALLAKTEQDTLSNLASAIRSGKVSDTSSGDLARTLLDYVSGELEITNPRFLKRRREQ
jgi:hypothetical protein